MAAAAKAKGIAAITDVAMRRLFAPEFQTAHPDLMRDRREAFLKTDPHVLQSACAQLGEHDEATPPAMSRELAALLPNAQLKIVSGCAHVPQLQAPEVFLEAIRGFL